MSPTEPWTGPEWVVKAYALPLAEDGHEIWSRACPSGDNAKAWGKGFSRGLLDIYPLGARLVIFDPQGRRWREADIIPSTGARLRWV